MVWAPEPRAETASQSNYQMDKTAYYMLQKEIKSLWQYD